jgi:hypothetical protein
MKLDRIILIAIIFFIFGIFTGLESSATSANHEAKSTGIVYLSDTILKCEVIK